MNRVLALASSSTTSAPPTPSTQGACLQHWRQLQLCPATFGSGAHHQHLSDLATFSSGAGGSVNFSFAQLPSVHGLTFSIGVNSSFAPLTLAQGIGVSIGINFSFEPSA